MNFYPQPGDAQAGDAELLRAFRTTRDEDAFRMLAERHAGMVKATALRMTGQRPRHG